MIETGQKPAERAVILATDFVTTDPFTSKLYPDATMLKIELGTNAFKDQPPGLTLPITPDWVDITAAEAAGS